jgi:hypothetical protein
MSIWEQLGSVQHGSCIQSAAIEDGYRSVVPPWSRFILIELHLCRVVEILGPRGHAYAAPGFLLVLLIQLVNVEVNRVNIELASVCRGSSLHVPVACLLLRGVAASARIAGMSCPQLDSVGWSGTLVAVRGVHSWALLEEEIYHILLFVWSTGRHGSRITPVVGTAKIACGSLQSQIYLVSGAWARRGTSLNIWVIQRDLYWVGIILSSTVRRILGSCPAHTWRWWNARDNCCHI